MDPTIETSAVNLPIHKHPLYPLSRYHDAPCEGCHVEGHIYEGYRCNESDCYNTGGYNGACFHKECGESPPEINHPSHSKHPIILTEDIWEPCDFCERFVTSGYRCAICNFVIDIVCAKKPQPPLAVEHPMFHEHPLVRSRYMRYIDPCKICKNYVAEGFHYECLDCLEVFHLECVNQSREVNHSSHPNHPLEFFTSESLSENAEKTCVLCGKESQHVLYHCSICNFSICIYCVWNPPPLTTDHTKTHKHKLFLLSGRVSFTCNVCGMEGDRSPYSCIQCSLLVHRECIDLPRVIFINRHDHRIFLSGHLGRGFLKCGVCHQSVNEYCGAYTCSTCPNFVVHSSCPTKYGVWDGIELEEIPEEEVIAPFIVVGDNLIKHFSHEEHVLRLENDGIVRDEKTRCEACVSLVCSDPIYSCEQCGFILHETCANLPTRKRLPFHNVQFKLHATSMDSSKAFKCYACDGMFSGFRYVANSFSIDVRCGTFSELVSYDFHNHPLYYGAKKPFLKCGACQRGVTSEAILSCDECRFVLDFRCYNLPRVIKHKYNERPLTLCYGENSGGKYWCDICEGETNPKEWFYTCLYSGVTLHVRCVFGDFSFLMSGRIMEYMGCKFEVVPNNHFTRPLCAHCQSRCIGPFFLKIYDRDIIYICSQWCLFRRIFHPIGQD